jgi:carboxylesterase
MPPRILPGAEAFRFDGGQIGVLLQHGFTGSPASMRPFGEWLAGQGLTVIAPRLPGHGTSWEELEGTTWQAWEAEAENAVEELARRCSTVVAVGLSMGGAMVLHLGAKRPDAIRGVVAINPDVRRPELVLVPLLRLVMRTTKGIRNDINKPAQDEIAYGRVPLRAVVQLGKLYRTVQKELPSLHVPLLIFSSNVDHVVRPSNARFAYARAGSAQKELVPLANSYHVATLDFDAEMIFERTLAFTRALAAGEAATA